MKLTPYATSDNSLNPWIDYYGAKIRLASNQRSNPSPHIDNQGKDIIILRKGPTQGFGKHSLTPEKMYSINFTLTRKKFCFSLHFNGANSYLFANGTEIYKFKAKDSKFLVGPIWLGNISKDWSLDNMKKTGFTGCFLCKKDTCTTSHILGACKVALSQGRFTFRHDNVLRIIISNIRSSIKTIKSSVPSSKQPIKIKFVKKGTIVKTKNSSPSGLLHQASDWVLLGDLDGTFSFPPHIAFTELRPDITIFSNKLKRVILIELTCPCEENMEAWHNAKVNKYLPLKSVIENNGWSVDLFAVEVGARGYCSRSVLCCFKSLGLRNRTINTTIKQISKRSMECSFCIWLARSKFFENTLTSSSWFYKREHLLCKCHPADTKCLSIALE